MFFCICFPGQQNRTEQKFYLDINYKLYWLATSGGRVPVVAVCVLHTQLRICCDIDLACLKRIQKKHIQRKIDQMFCLGGNRQSILPTYSHSNTVAVSGDDNLSNTNN